MPDLTTKDALLEKLVQLTAQLKDYIPEELAKYLPLAGGTMTGAIKGDPVTLTADDGNGNSASLVVNATGSLTYKDKKITVNYNTEDVTLTIDDDNVVQAGVRQNAYRSGCVVTVGINMALKANLVAGSSLLTNLPKPKAVIGASIASTTLPFRCYIDTDGVLKLDGAGPSAVDWVNGLITYVTID